MPYFVVRVWLPDRPGALGAVASRIGSVRADVVGIEILERGAGRAVDELTIDLEDERHVDLLIKEIAQVDGVDVEHVRPARAVFGDRGVVSLDVATAIVAASGGDAVLHALSVGSKDLFGADWAAVVAAGTGPSAVLASAGDALPSAEWLAAFVVGTSLGGAAAGGAAVDELARAPLGETGHELVLSRSDLPLRDVERSMLERLADLAATRLAETA